MREIHKKWFSPSIGREFDMLVFGEAGTPMILFATSQGRYVQNRDFGFIEVMGRFIEKRLIKVYCPDSYDNESFYAYHIHPGERLKHHLAFERLLVSEVLEAARDETGYPKVMVAGCSFGGYHAFNFAMKHPWLVSHSISMGGVFDIKQYIFGYYDDNCYFNDPVEYLPNLEDRTYLDEYAKMKIIISTGEHDMCRGDSLNISHIMCQKKIAHTLDDRPGMWHDWPCWKQQIVDYLTQLYPI